MKLFMIEESQIQKLEQTAKRLYTEDRMNGDEMRDLAQTLDVIARACRQVMIEGSGE